MTIIIPIKTINGEESFITLPQPKLIDNHRLKPSGGDDGIIINKIFNSGVRSIILDEGTFLIGTKINVPINGLLCGQCRASSLKKTANIDMFNLMTGATLKDLIFTGQGNKFSGRGIVMAAGTAYQKIINVNGDSQGYVLHCDGNNAGGSLQVSSSGFTRYPSYGLPAIKLPDWENPYGGNRRFQNIDSYGGYAFDLAGAQHTILEGCMIAGFTMNTNARSLNMHGCRVGSPEGYLLLQGTGHMIIGNFPAHPWAVQCYNSLIIQPTGGSGVWRQDPPENGNVVW